MLHATFRRTLLPGTLGHLQVVDKIIESLLKADRAATIDLLRQLRTSVSLSGFDSSALTRAGSMVAGTTWQGRVIESSDRLPNSVRHYLRHVVSGKEWPTGTSFADYLESLRTTILDANGGVLLETFPMVRRLTFVAPSGPWRGPHGGPYILVGYNLGYGYWVTGFQPHDERLFNLQSASGVHLQWLQHLK